MALFDLQPRSTRVSDSQAIRKSTTSKKVNTGVTIKGSGGLLDRITAITTGARMKVANNMVYGPKNA